MKTQVLMEIQLWENCPPRQGVWWWESEGTHVFTLIPIPTPYNWIGEVIW